MTIPQRFIRANEVLDERLSESRIVDLETRFGNADFFNATRALGFGGPFRVVSPWELEEEGGRRLINAGGYSAMPFGEAYPPLVDFLKEFLEKNTTPGMPQQIVSPWRAALQANLVALLAREAPSHADSKVFFSNSGAEAIESALKFAKAARPKAKYFVNFTSAYHGKTFMALSITPNKDYQAIFEPLMRGVRTLPYGDTDAFERALKTLGPDKIVTVIVEPLQGEAGVVRPPDGFLERVGELCRKHGIPVIADEIQSGLGRTGHWFESLARGLEPDILTLAKPLGGGLVPIGATIVRKKLFRAMLSGTDSKRHSNTFGGNSISMAVGLKSLEILMDEDLPARASRLGDVGLARLRETQRRYPQFLQAVRGQGMLFALQFHTVLDSGLLKSQAELLAEASGLLGMRELHEVGVQANVTLSSKRTVRLTPALNMPDDLFGAMFDRVDEAAAKNKRAFSMLPSAVRGIPTDRLGKLIAVLLDKARD